VKALLAIPGYVLGIVRRATSCRLIWKDLWIELVVLEDLVLLQELLAILQ